MATQGERRESTRSAILDSAQRLFEKGGYANTSIQDIIDGAGVSRGALYHHFKSKEAIFAAVFLATSADAIRQAGSRIPSGVGPRASLIAGCVAWLDVVSDEHIGQILLVDGPLALGWERARALEETTSLGSMRSAIQNAIDAGELQTTSADLFARLLSATLTEAALSTPRGGVASGSSHDRRSGVEHNLTRRGLDHASQVTPSRSSGWIRLDQDCVAQRGNLHWVESNR